MTTMTYRILSNAEPPTETVSVDYSRRRETEADVDDGRGQPGERHCRVDHPRTGLGLVPDRKHNLDVPLDGDGCQVQHGSVESEPENGLAVEQHTQPVAKSSSQTDWKDFHEEGNDEHDGAVEIE